MGTALGRLTGWALVAALGTAALAGCSAEAEPDPAPTTTESAEVFSSDEEALAAAEAAYREYVELSNAVTAGEGSSEDFRPLMTDTFYEQNVDAAASASAQGIRTEGATALSNFSLQERRGDLLSFYVCSDVSAVRIYDATGTDVTPTDRSGVTTFLVTAEVEDSAVLLASSEAWEVGACSVP